MRDPDWNLNCKIRHFLCHLSPFSSQSSSSKSCHRFINFITRTRRVSNTVLSQSMIQTIELPRVNSKFHGIHWRPRREQTLEFPDQRRRSIFFLFSHLSADHQFIRIGSRRVSISRHVPKSFRNVEVSLRFIARVKKERNGPQGSLRIIRLESIKYERINFSFTILRQPFLTAFAVAVLQLVYYQSILLPWLRRNVVL